MFDLCGRKGEAVDNGADHRFSTRPQRFGFQLPYRIGRFSDDDVREALRGCHTTCKMRKHVGSDHHCRNTALFEGWCDVATPRRTRPSVSGRSYDHIDTPGEIVQSAAQGIEEFAVA